jgi:hypothetical protein
MRYVCIHHLTSRLLTINKELRDEICELALVEPKAIVLISRTKYHVRILERVAACPRTGRFPRAVMALPLALELTADL